MACFVGFLLSVVLALAGIFKLKDVAEFALALETLFPGLPAEAIKPLACILPFVEIYLAVFLLVPGVRAAAARLAAGLFLVFIGVILSAMVRGIDANCPCFGTLDLICTGPLGLCHLARNAVFLALSIWLSRVPQRSWRPPVDRPHASS